MKNQTTTKTGTTVLALLIGGLALLGTASDADAVWKNNCRQEGGTPVHKVTVSRCSDGEQKVTIWWTSSRKTSQVQACRNKGTRGQNVPAGTSTAYSSGRIDGQCVKKTGSGKYTWNDGASEPLLAAMVSEGPLYTPIYKSLFRPAGVRHDHCYHHGKATYGFDKLHCDRELRSIAQKRCNKISWQSLVQLVSNVLRNGGNIWTAVAKTRTQCEAQAWKFYSALRWHPTAKKAYKYTNTVASYLGSGNYRLTGGLIFHVNNRGQYCRFTPDAWAAQGKKARSTQLKTNSVPGDLKSGGECALKSGTYRKPNGAIFYVNTKGQYCTYTWKSYKRAGKPRYRQLRSNKLPSSMVSHGTCR